MKVLRVIYSIDPKLGGPVEGLKQACRIMDTMDVQTEVATFDAPAEALKLDWPVHACGPAKLGKYGYCPELAKWLDKNVSRFDAVIIHGNWQYHGHAASKACRRHKVPYFIYPHGMLDPWFNENYPLKKLKKIPYWLFVEHPILKHASAVLFTTEEERILARKSFQPYTVNELVVGYGTSKPAKPPQPLQKQTSKSGREWGARPYFLFMGRIHEKKGLDLLIAAYQQIHQSNEAIPELVIAGPIEQEDYAKPLQSQQPQDKIHWVGSLSGELKWEVLASAEALILPSHQENFGIVVAEALAVGTPVLISNKVNIWREIETESAGLVADDDLAGTCHLLTQWLALEPSAKRAMSDAALHTFNTHFDMHNAVRRLFEIIQTTIASK